AAAGAAAGTAAVSASFLPQAARVAVTARASRAGRRFIAVGLLGNRAGRIAKGAWGWGGSMGGGRRGQVGRSRFRQAEHVQALLEAHVDRDLRGVELLQVRGELGANDA